MSKFTSWTVDTDLKLYNFCYPRFYRQLAVPDWKGNQN